MRKLGFRRGSTELPLPAGGGSVGAYARRTRRPRSPVFFICAVFGVFLFVLGVAAVFSTAPMNSLRRVHGAARSALTAAEEEEVAGQVRAEVLRRRGQQWTSASPPPPRGGAETAATVSTAMPGVTDALHPTTTTIATTNTTDKAAIFTATGLVVPPTPEPRLVVVSKQEGAQHLEEPDRLPGLQVHRRMFTSDELLERFGDTDYIYSFANGTESNHQYRKEVRLACLLAVLRAENESYTAGQSTLWTQRPTAETRADAPDVGQDEHGQTTALNPTLPASETPFTLLKCIPRFLKNGADKVRTLGDLLSTVEGNAEKGADNRDRETDELRHSLRSVEQHISWHRGRVVIVSPGHHPTWVDGAKNFLAGVCGDATVQALRSRGTHLRLTTVHQDAVMPYGMRFTANSHTIEQHIWRVRNTTAVHVYMNDDYFVNRDVAITDLFNEYGGTIVRTEWSRITVAAPGDHTASWAKGVSNTEQFSVKEVDVNKEDYLPAGLMEMWATQSRLTASVGGADALPAIAEAPLNEAVDVAHHYSPEPLPLESLQARRVRHYATHAPFVYCTNMFRFLEMRYEREFANTSLHHRGRKARDLFIPFLYNAFIMARPWQASPQFLPYLLQLHRSRAQTPSGVAPVVNISLDNFDGCAPATLLAGAWVNGCAFGKFSDDLKENQGFIDRVGQSNPLYFNINAGFNTPAAADQLRKFLHEKFPTPMYLERASDAAATADPEEAAAGGEEEGTTTTTTTANAVADAALTTLFDSLIALPVVGVVSHEEGACPLVRSLSLAFAGHHRGRVHVAVQRSNDGAEAETLRETRNRLGHRVVSAIPVPQCAFSSRVVVEASAVAESVADVARRVLAESDGAGVVLPSTCGGGFAGLRVRGFVVDARSPKTPVTSLADLPSVLAMPGQTLALEDFRAVRVGAEDGDVVLVLAREDATAKAVHWVTGASENDLLLTYPLPVRELEDLSASVKWVSP